MDRFTEQDFNPDYYERLQIGRDATASEIARAYKKRAEETHPDNNPENIKAATAEFVALGRAYEVLKDSKRRVDYDYELNRRKPARKTDFDAVNKDYSDSAATSRRHFSEVRINSYAGMEYTQEEVDRYKDVVACLDPDECGQSAPAGPSKGTRLV